MLFILVDFVCYGLIFMCEYLVGVCGNFGYDYFFVYVFGENRMVDVFDLVLNVFEKCFCCWGFFVVVVVVFGSRGGCYVFFFGVDLGWYGFGGFFGCFDF